MRALLAMAACRLLLHTLTNGQHGFHRDETRDARRRAAPRLGLCRVPAFHTVRGARRSGAVRFRAGRGKILTALAQSIAMVVACLIARELGGGRRAQIITALAVAVSPVSMSAGHLFQYVSFDLLSVVAVYFVIRLLKSEDQRWWLAVGAAIGMGLMTRYTIAWLVAGLAVGFLLAPARKLLTTFLAVGYSTDPTDKELCLPSTSGCPLTAFPRFASHSR